MLLPVFFLPHPAKSNSSPISIEPFPLPRHEQVPSTRRYTQSTLPFQPPLFHDIGPWKEERQDIRNQVSTHKHTHIHTHLCTASLVDFYAQDQYTFHKESTLKIYPQTRLLPYILHNKKFVPTYTRRRTPQPPSTVSNQFRRVPLRFQIKYIASIIILQVTKV